MMFEAVLLVGQNCSRNQLYDGMGMSRVPIISMHERKNCIINFTIRRVLLTAILPSMYFEKATKIRHTVELYRCASSNPLCLRLRLQMFLVYKGYSSENCL